jgi:hypothetical protein
LIDRAVEPLAAAGLPDARSGPLGSCGQRPPSPGPIGSPTSTESTCAQPAASLLANLLLANSLAARVAMALESEPRGSGERGLTTSACGMGCSLGSNPSNCCRRMTSKCIAYAARLSVFDKFLLPADESVANRLNCHSPRRSTDFSAVLISACFCLSGAVETLVDDSYSVASTDAVIVPGHGASKQAGPPQQRHKSAAPIPKAYSPLILTET